VFHDGVDGLDDGDPQGKEHEGDDKEKRTTLKMAIASSTTILTRSVDRSTRSVDMWNTKSTRRHGS
jgi:hypothetical protein